MSDEDGTVTPRNEGWGRDEAAHPWAVHCKKNRCYFAICADTEQDGWRKLEEHQLSDQCPTPVKIHKPPSSTTAEAMIASLEWRQRLGQP